MSFEGDTQWYYVGQTTDGTEVFTAVLHHKSR